MLGIDKVTYEHKEEVIEFLSKMFIIDMETATNKFGTLFEHKWCVDEPAGYAIFDEGKIVGFIGTIYANRTINGQSVKTCNLTSWAVDENYRGKGLKLISFFIKRKNILFTDFTANDASRRVFEFYKFNSLESHEYILPAIPLPDIFSKKFAYNTFDIKELTDEDKQVYLDHVNTKAIRVLVKEKENYVFLILTHISKKKLPFIEVSYCSSNHQDFLESDLTKILRYLAFKNMVVGAILDSRFINHIPKFCITKNIKHKIYKNSTTLEIEKKDIDSAYSEKILFV